MKVAITALDLPTEGGINTYLKNIIKHLPDKNEYYIYIPNDKINKLPAYEDHITYVPISPLFSNLILRVLFMQLYFPFILKKHNFDIVFSSTGDYTCLFSSCPSVFIIHDFSPYLQSLDHHISRPRLLEIKFKIQKLLTKLSAHSANIVIFPSEFSRNICIPQLGISEERSVVVHHGVDLERFTPRYESKNTSSLDSLKLPISNDYILSVSTLYEHKNFEVLLRAYAKLPEKLQKDHPLVIVGSPSTKSYFSKLHQIANELNIKENIYFTGGVGYDSIPELYRKSSLFILPSKLETFGLTPVEAMACGIPVIATDSTAIPEVVQNAGYLFDSDDSDQLRDMMQTLLLNEEIRKEYREAGLRRAQELSWEETAEKTHEVLYNINIHNRRNILLSSLLSRITRK